MRRKNYKLHGRRATLRYFGGGWLEAPSVVDSIQSSFHTYGELFLGGGSIFYNLDFAPEVRRILNDINPETINFHWVLRENPQALIEQIRAALQMEWKTAFDWSATPLIPHGEYPETDYQSENPKSDHIHQAARTYVYSRLSFGGAGSRGNSGTSSDSHKRFLQADPEYLLERSAHLQGAELYCQDALSLIPLWDDPGTLMVLDPTFPKESRGSRDNRAIKGSVRQGYRFDTTDRASDRLFHTSLATAIKGTQTMSLLLGYECPLYDTLYPGTRKVNRWSRTTAKKTASKTIWLFNNLQFAEQQELLVSEGDRYLLIVDCSKRKRADESVLAAIERYDGPIFQSLRQSAATCPDWSWKDAEGPVDVAILSAKYGLINPLREIRDYDQGISLEDATSEWMQSQTQRVLRQLIENGNYRGVLLCMDADYMAALRPSLHLLSKLNIQTVSGKIGERSSAITNWLSKLLQDAA